MQKFGLIFLGAVRVLATSLQRVELHDFVHAFSVEDGTMRPPLPKTDKYLELSYLEEARRSAQ